MSMQVTLYPDADSTFWPLGGPLSAVHGRAYVRVSVDGADIQTDCWEDAQRLVDALTEAITWAKHIEQDAALAATS